MKLLVTVEEIALRRPDFQLIEHGEHTLVAIWSFRGEPHELIAVKDARPVLLSACMKSILEADVRAQGLPEFIGPPRPSPHIWGRKTP